MRIFVTGATGFIGSRVVSELLKAGHQVLGVARSKAGAEALAVAGAQVHRGTLDDPESLRSGAANSDGVIHLAFDHDMTNFVANCEKDKRVIEVLGTALAGSDRPLVITSGTGMGGRGPGQNAVEDHFNVNNPHPRKASELAGASLLERGVNISVVRLPQVHDTVKQGLVTRVVILAREKGVSAYLGEGLNRWPAAHVTDVARLYKLAVEKHQAGARYNAVDEEGVTVREIAEVVGSGLKVPVASMSPQDAAAHFGWMGMFIGVDMPASSALTQERLGWKPTGPGMIADLERMNYFPVIA